MIRFIDLDTQLYSIDEPRFREFAFFCTTIWRFETHSDTQTWTTREDFIRDYEGHNLQRYLRLIPPEWP